jgi:ABC-2 type transport system permease protein
VIRVEFRKQLRRLRTYIGFGIVALIPIIFTVSFKANPPKGRGRGNDAFFALATHSGINIPLAALTAVSAFLLIVVVSLFAGETIAGEASWGTLRYLLVRPVRRGRLLGSKLLVACVLSLIATLIVSIVALAAGVAAFGWHPVLTPQLLLMPQGTAVARLALATLYVTWSMGAYLSFAFMLSAMTDTSFGAVAGGVGLGVVSQILNNISALDNISFVFPTHYLDSWNGLFMQPIQGGDMVRGVILQIPYIVVFLGVAWWWFARKDVVS